MEFKTDISAYRCSEDNWDIRDHAKELGFNKEAVSNLKYLGNVEMTVLIKDDGSSKLLEINGVDVSEKGIYV